MVRDKDSLVPSPGNGHGQRNAFQYLLRFFEKFAGDRGTNPLHVVVSEKDHSSGLSQSGTGGSHSSAAGNNRSLNEKKNFSSRSTCQSLHSSARQRGSLSWGYFVDFTEEEEMMNRTMSRNKKSGGQESF